MHAGLAVGGAPNILLPECITATPTHAPLGWKASAWPNPLGSWNVWTERPVRSSHTLTVLSSEQEDSRRPSGDQRTHRTQLVCSDRLDVNRALDVQAKGVKPRDKREWLRQRPPKGKSVNSGYTNL